MSEIIFLFVIQDSREQLAYIPSHHGSHLLALSTCESILQCYELLGDQAVLHQSPEDQNGKCYT